MRVARDLFDSMLPLTDRKELGALLMQRLLDEAIFNSIKVSFHYSVSHLFLRKIGVLADLHFIF